MDSIIIIIIIIIILAQPALKYEQPRAIQLSFSPFF